MANWSTQTAMRECQIAANGQLTVVERLATLLETGQFADVTIRVGEGKDTATFKAHRLLLATASQPLSKLVTSNTKNGSPGDSVILHVNDVDPEAFQHVLKYIYTDDLQISNVGISLTLLKMGKKWGLQKLVERTLKFLESFLNEYEPMTEDRKNELCELTVLTEEYGLDLNTKCWNVLVKNVNEVVPCQGFLNMNKAMVRRLLFHPDFQFKDQLVLFEAIRDWGMNQVLQRNLGVNNLQGLIGEFLELVDFKAIQDVDFLDTILPSECLGKAELIAFFMARGLEIPRNLEYNNNQEDCKMPFEKTGRYKRGFKISHQEIYKEHELRFRVDKRLRLLGVGFGFLFSNTDMGITVHCQGPWETRQWRDIIQSYCRVTWEKMKTADVRLMFSEPVIIEPNHSYKILVRVSRMSAGSSDVDLWGGAHGVSRLKMTDAEFSFLKAAIDPKKEVEEADTENKPGMITDLFYELDDGSENSSPRTYNSMGYAKTESSPPPPKKISREPLTNNSLNTSDVGLISQEGGTSPSSYSFRRNVPSSRVEVEDDTPTPSTPVKKKTHVDEASSYYLAHKPSSIKGSETLPAFLKSRQPSVERNKSWQIPSRTGISTTAASTYKPREPSVHREPSTPRDSGFSSRHSVKGSSRVSDNSTLGKYSSGISGIKSRYDIRQPTRSGYETSYTTSLSSRYGTNTPRTTTRYTSSGSDNKFGGESSTSSSRNTSRYGRESTASPSRASTTSQPYSRLTQPTTQNKEKESGGSRPSVTSTSLGSSRYGLTTSSRYGTGSHGSSSSAYGTGSSSTRSNDKIDSSTGNSNRFGSSSNTTSSIGTGRYSSASSSTPNYLSSSRFGVTSPIGKSYTGFSSRFGSSLYRR